MLQIIHLVRYSYIPRHNIVMGHYATYVRGVAYLLSALQPYEKLYFYKKYKSNKAIAIINSYMCTLQASKMLPTRYIASRVIFCLNYRLVMLKSQKGWVLETHITYIKIN